MGPLSEGQLHPLTLTLTLTLTPTPGLQGMVDRGEIGEIRHAR